MKLTKSIIFVLIAGLIATNANAVTFGSETVKEIIQWQDNSPIYFKLTTSGEWCYIPATEKNMYSLVLSLYVSGKSSHFECNDIVDNYGSINGRRLMRINAY